MNVDVLGIIENLINDSLADGKLYLDELQDSKQEMVNDFYNMFTDKKNRVIPDAICKWIDKRYHILLVNGLFYFYINGVYVPDDKNSSKMCQFVLNFVHPMNRNHSKIKGIADYIRDTKGSGIKFEEMNKLPSDCICFKNGVYNTRTKELLEHNPKYRCTFQIPFNYDQNAEYTEKDTKQIDTFLNHLCVAEDDKNMLLTFLGYCMTIDTSMQRFLILYGKPGCGKSILVNLMAYVLGKENVSNVKLEDMCGDKFASYNLVGKIANFANEIGARPIDDTATFKQITGEDDIRVQRKFGDGFSFKPIARHIFTANDLPIIKNRDEAFYRRPLILHVVKMPEKKDEKLLDKLTTHADYFISLCVKALEKYQKLDDKESIISKESVDMVEYWQGKSDSVKAFLNVTQILEENPIVERKKLFDSYLEFCQEEERSPLSRNNFYDSLMTKGYPVITKNGTRYFKGHIDKNFKTVIENPFEDMAAAGQFS